MACLEAVTAGFFFEGYEDYFRSMAVRDEMVPSHNDAQENNILASLENN